MIRGAGSIERFALRARDGEIGHVDDFFFDDRHWTIRYLVVNTGSWLSHRDVLVSPAAADVPDWNTRTIPVSLTREQVRGSPAVDTEEPVSPADELALARYYDWPTYWANPTFAADGILFSAPPFLPVTAPPRRAGRRHERGGGTVEQPHHLRSVSEVRGYRIEANDGEFGQVEEFLLNVHTWRVAYLVIATKHWLPGRRVVIAPEWIYEVGWDEAKVFVDLSRDTIEHSPVYDPREGISGGYVDALDAHYGFPRRSAEP